MFLLYVIIIIDYCLVVLSIIILIVIIVIIIIIIIIIVVLILIIVTYHCHDVGQQAELENVLQDPYTTGFAGELSDGMVASSI